MNTPRLFVTALFHSTQLKAKRIDDDWRQDTKVNLPIPPQKRNSWKEDSYERKRRLKKVKESQRKITLFDFEQA